MRSALARLSGAAAYSPHGCETMRQSIGGSSLSAFSSDSGFYTRCCGFGCSWNTAATCVQPIETIPSSAKPTPTTLIHTTWNLGNCFHGSNICATKTENHRKQQNLKAEKPLQIVHLHTKVHRRAFLSCFISTHFVPLGHEERNTKHNQRRKQNAQHHNRVS